MLGFRKKIFLTDLVLLIVFISALFPLIGLTVNHIMRISLANRGKVLIATLKDAPNQDAMLEMMRSHSEFVFQPASLFDGNGNVIYRSFATEQNQFYESENEVREAIETGHGFDEHISPFFHQKYYYSALKFSAHNQSYILDVNFRGSEIDQIKLYFKMGILIVCILLLLVKSSLDIVIIRYFMLPVQQIVNAIRPYREGKEELLPRIVLTKAMQGGEFSKLASTINSLTERIQKQIENLTRQREETEEILESIGEGIIATDTSANVTFINRKAAEMLDESPNDILKKTLADLKSSDLSKKCHELILYALQTSESSIQTLTLREKGPLYLDLISAPLAHQNGALVVLQDKTSDYKIVELGKDFIANASHELRTPITIIRGFAETLQDLPELSQEMLHQITEKIVRTCMRLDTLVRSLLTLSDIENLSHDRFKPTDLILLAENCRHHVLTANPSVKIQIQSDLDSAPIIADADLLELAIINLLENGVKYSTGPAQIEIQIEKSDQGFRLIIKDQGIGISKKDLPHVFDRFYTVDKARSRKSGGAGLGLSIVKTIIEKHKGKVLVASEVGKGSAFSLITPSNRNSSST
ncbi:MAG: histidine kinase [Chlamydiae bacterium CG10_big_fil_rev_8_21_14_0_10_42_34]|nr:MAG: histidine kinase [Chlamydiae bacterium CG10_big_fil_rev_8_21_14_0_10_42_34]